MSLAVLILTFNEDQHIKRALLSAAGLATNVFVVDSYSTDRTVEIAKECGACVLQNPFINQAKQFQWGLDNAPIECDWIMRLDADEVLEPELVAEIKRKLPMLPADIVGVNLKRRHIFMGRWIRHGGRYPLTLLRIFKRGKGRVENRWMDEHLVVWGGRTVTFDNDFSDFNLGDLTHFTNKHNAYATREAIDVLNTRYGLFAAEKAFSNLATSQQATLKRWIKENIYNMLPFGVGPFGYFLFRYFAQLGFLDGREGLVYHFLQGFWYRFLVEAKVVEYDRLLKDLPDRQRRLQTLAKLTGYRVVDLEGVLADQRA